MALSRHPFGTMLLLVLAGFLYLATMMSLSDALYTDAAYHGMALGLAEIFGSAMMLLLAILLVVAAVKGEMSATGKVGAYLLVPLATAAMWVAVDLYGHRVGWAIAVPLLLPLLVAAYALRARLPSLRAWMSARTADLALGGAILLLSVVPLVWTALPRSAAAAHVAAHEQARLDREAAEMRVEEARDADTFAKLGPDSSLRDYLQYLPGGDSRSQEALAGARRVKSRQADAVALLKAGRLPSLTLLFKLDLQPTPELCQAYGDALSAAASHVIKTRPDYLSIAIDLEQQLPNIHWLTGAGCSLNSSLDLLAEHVHAVSDSRRMDTFAARLLKLKR
ncbi:MAG: hypothetical protein JSR24_16880 [Proteobacteria bacterium]|nr:hypothetical protein [Pseudomonadota bacterium]